MSSMLRIVLFLVAIVQSALGDCPLGWVEFGDSCYSFSDDSLSWYEALAVCTGYGGRLVQDDNQAKHDFLADQMKTRSIDFAWIGGSCRHHVPNWVWVPSLRPFNFTKWHAGEPNYITGSQCVWLEAGMEYEWDNAPCSIVQRFICERAQDKDITCLRNLVNRCTL